MSIAIMSWVFKNGPRDAGERLVLLALADYCDDNGEWAPSMAGIAEKAGMTERGARGVVRRLEAGGWIEVRVGGGRGGCSFYRVLTAENPEPETRNEKPGMRNPECGDTKPGTSRHKTRNRASAEPSVTIKEPSKSKDARDALCSVLSEKVADDFIAHRRAMRKPLTARAAELIAGRLATCGDPDAVANLSIMNGWQGVFPERGNEPVKSFSPKFDLSKFEETR